MEKTINSTAKGKKIIMIKLKMTPNLKPKFLHRKKYITKIKRKKYY